MATISFIQQASAGGANTFPCSIKKNLDIKVEIEGKTYLVSDLKLTYSKSPHSMSAVVTNTKDSSDSFDTVTNTGDCRSIGERIFVVNGTGKCEFDENTDVFFSFDANEKTCEVFKIEKK